MVEAVEKNPFVPIKWIKEHKGMQGYEYWEEEKEINDRREIWLNGRDFAVSAAKDLDKLGVTKQFCNRMLETYMWHTVLVTATDWENFFALRADPAAEIHMQELANKMLEEYNSSLPAELKEGEWHIPFGDGMKMDMTPMEKVKIATARCARVSYTVSDLVLLTPSPSVDIALHDRLLQNGHMSPFEHCAQVPRNSLEVPVLRYGNFGSNFNGFVQYRKMIPNENRRDPRVLVK
jgi:hypothetical protein